MADDQSQVANIPLDSSLEVSSEKTLVPISKPTFLENNSEVYNGTLTNSVKYESNGWFVDWSIIDLHQHMFKDNVIVEPSNSSFDLFGGMEISDTVLNFVMFDSTSISCSYDGKLISAKNCTVDLYERVNDELVFEGTLSDGSPYKFYVNCHDLSIRTDSFVPPNPPNPLDDYDILLDQQNGILDIKILKKGSTIDMVQIKSLPSLKGLDFDVIEGGQDAFDLETTKQLFNKLFEIDTSAQTVTSKDTGTTIDPTSITISPDGYTYKFDAQVTQKVTQTLKIITADGIRTVNIPNYSTPYRIENLFYFYLEQSTKDFNTVFPYTSYDVYLHVPAQGHVYTFPYDHRPYDYDPNLFPDPLVYPDDLGDYPAYNIYIGKVKIQCEVPDEVFSWEWVGPRTDPITLAWPYYENAPKIIWPSNWTPYPPARDYGPPIDYSTFPPFPTPVLPNTTVDYENPMIGLAVTKEMNSNGQGSHISVVGQYDWSKAPYFENWLSKDLIDFQLNYTVTKRSAVKSIIDASSPPVTLFGKTYSPTTILGKPPYDLDTDRIIVTLEPEGDEWYYKVNNKTALGFNNATDILKNDINNLHITNIKLVSTSADNATNSTTAVYEIEAVKTFRDIEATILAIEGISPDLVGMNLVNVTPDNALYREFTVGTDKGVVISYDEQSHLFEVTVDGISVVVKKEGDTPPDIFLSWKRVSKDTMMIKASIIGMYLYDNRFTYVDAFIDDPKLIMIITDQNGQTITVIYDPTIKPYTEYRARDIRTEDQKVIFKTNDTERIINRSKWLTSKEEDCYVVDLETLIVIEYNREIVLYKKKLNPNNEGGYEWAVPQLYEWYEKDRRDMYDCSFIKPGVRYGCSCAYNAKPYLWRTRMEGTRFYVAYIEAPTNDLAILTQPWPEMFWEIINLGTTGPINVFSTTNIEIVGPYIDPSIWYTTIKISSVYLPSGENQGLWLGLAYDKGVRQWCVNVSNGGMVKTGHGYVGPDGLMTGGQFPVEISDGTGSIRCDLESLDASFFSAIQLEADAELVPSAPDRPNSAYFIKTFRDHTRALLTSSGALTFIGPISALQHGYNLRTKEACEVPVAISQAFYQCIWDLDKHQIGVQVIPMLPAKIFTFNLCGFDVVTHGAIGAASTTMLTGAGAGAGAGAGEKKKEDPKMELAGDDSKFEAISMSLRPSVKAASLGSLGALEKEAYAMGNSLAGSFPTISTDPSNGGSEQFSDGLRLTCPSGGNLSLSMLTVSRPGMRAQIRLEDLFCIGANSHIYAGPGFVQAHYIKSGTFDHTFSYSQAWHAGGNGVDLMAVLGEQLATLLGIQVLGSGTASSSNLFGGADAGVPHGLAYPYAIGSMVALFPYRQIGSSHHYYNYPVKDMETYDLQETTNQIGLNKSDRVYANSYYFIARNKLLSCFDTESNSWTVRGVIPDLQGPRHKEYQERIGIIIGSTTTGRILSEAGPRQAKGSRDFSNPFQFDYCVIRDQDLWYTAIDGDILYVSIKDTKVLDGPPTNVVVDPKMNRVLIGSPYCALEIMNENEYDVHNLRARALTPQTLVFNQTGVNAVHGNRVYHVCDAYSCRVIANMGEVGSDIEELNTVSTFIADDDFKQSSIFPPISLFGKFSTAFIIRYSQRYQVEVKSNFYHTLLSNAEDPKLYRYSIPIINDRLSILPATMKTLAAYKLTVIEGVTSLTTPIRSTTKFARRPDSIDFPIYGEIFRWNPEYISEIKSAMGVQSITDLVATIGLDYKGSTPDTAWFYSPSIRAMYIFQPKTVKRTKNVDRFRDVVHTEYDFITQECVAKVVYMDGTVNYVRYNTEMTGTLYPPVDNIGPDYEFYSMAGGFVFQGLHRCNVHRFLITDQMVPMLKQNQKKWKRIQGRSIDDYNEKRDYTFKFRWDHAWGPEITANDFAPLGWRHDPWAVRTAMLGTDDGSECKFEWLINLAISDIIDSIIGNQFVTLNIAAETMTVGGLVKSEVQHIRLHSSMFSREGRFGYYSLKFNSNTGIGNSESLRVWSDGIVSVRGIKGIQTQKTQRRASSNEDYGETQGMEEM